MFVNTCAGQTYVYVCSMCHNVQSLHVFEVMPQQIKQETLSLKSLSLARAVCDETLHTLRPRSGDGTAVRQPNDKQGALSSHAGMCAGPRVYASLFFPSTSTTYTFSSAAAADAKFVRQHQVHRLSLQLTVNLLHFVLQSAVISPYGC